VREPHYDPVSDVSDPLEKISNETSHPRWLIERWARAFGVEEAEAFAKANNVVPPTAFRVVKVRANESEVLNKLSSAGAAVEASQIAEGAWRVSGATSVVRELSAAGEIYLQDEASQRVAELLDVKPGERVLDLCAAPGGKTSLMAGRAGDLALIIAGDRSAKRMETVIATTTLHGLESIKPLLLDAGEKLPFPANTFDKVLLDAPCSGTGTLRRNPEIRWRLSESDIRVFAENQKRFLANAADVVKPGGRLVYSTCSVERDENEEVIERLDERFKVIATQRTWPQRQGCDGFFVAVFDRGQD
jgi:16S rRNA (cytosine967-C5)-methyltransferase